MPGSELELPGFRDVLSALSEPAAIFHARELSSPIAANEAYLSMAAQGQTFPVSMTERTLGSPPQGDGYILRMASRVVEDHDENAAAQQMADREQWLRHCFAHATIGLALVKLSGSVDHVNDAYAGMCGLPASELLGSHAERWIHPESLAERRRQLQLLLAGSSSGFTMDTRYLRPDGYDAWVNESVSIIGDEDSSTRHIVVIAEDITRRRQSERALLQTESLVSMGRLAASISHELNNPLESVNNLLFLMNHAESLEDIRQYGALAEQELGRVSTIAAQTLRFYRPQSAPAALQMSDILDSVLALFAGRIRREQVTVVRRYRPDVQPVVAFSGELRQVFVNLVGNALDAMEAPATLHICVKSSWHWRTGQRGVRVVVADTGTGIPKAMLQKVFEAFVTTKEKTGTGLGLWISLDIVRRQGGTFQVRSSVEAPKRGTCMSVFLPYEQLNQQAHVHQNASAA